MPKNSTGEVLNVNSHLSFADQLFHKYKTLYNEKSKTGKQSIIIKAFAKHT